ncbi:MAG: CdvA-like protein [Candidatus Bathyarchaeota archaeon]
MTQESNFFMSIGRQIKDEYGRMIGRVTSLAVNPYGRVDSAFIQHGNYKITKYPVESLKMEDSEVILLSKTKMKAMTLSDQIPLIWRKNQALRTLLDKDKISPEVYEDLHGSFDGVLDQLTDEAQTLADDIDEEMDRCKQEIKNLNYALVNLEIEHEIGKIGEESYQKAFTAIQECLKTANTEKSDLETMKSRLSNIILGDLKPPTEEAEKIEETEQEIDRKSEVQEEVPEIPTPPSDPTPGLPEPPVVVYVKEAGTSGA